MTHHESEKNYQYWKNIFNELPMNQLFQIKLTQQKSTVVTSNFQIDNQTLSQINSCCTLYNIDKFTVFLSVMSLLIAKFTNSASVAVGCLGNEPNDNLTIFHTILQDSLSTKELLQSTQKKYNEMQRYSSDAISKIMSESQVNSTNELFPASLKLSKKCADTQQLHSLFDVNVMTNKDSLTVSISADSSQLSQQNITSLQQTFENILNILTTAENAEIDVMNLETLKTTDFSALEQWSQHSKPHTPFSRIEDAFNAICQSHSQKISIEYNGKHYSYADIDAWSDKVATSFMQLNSSGVMALCMEKSVELTVSVIAALKANLSYLLIDTKNPSSRIEYMLQDTGCDIVITNTLLEFKSTSSTLIQFNSLDLTNGNHTDAQTKPKNSIACILYTSGSTGNPKPVMINHSAIINLIWNQHKYFGVTKDDRILQFSSVSFDSSIAEIWIPLLSGATSIIPSDKYLSGELLEDTIIDNKVSVLIIPPSVLDTIPNPDDVCKTLNVLVSVGEALTTSTIKTWAGKLPHFLNAYGPSEGTVLTSFYRYHEETTPNNIIGKPIDGVYVYVLNDNLTFSPIDCTGELYIGGAGLSPGYYQHPELDENRFITNPFKKGEKLYKTGDLVRWKHDGNLQYVGRVDRQVKLNGVRIELEEIENQLQAHPLINLCAVCIETNETSSEKKLIAYFTRTADATNPITDLKKTIRHYLSNCLPMSMVPHHYREIDEFPRLPSGKIARDKLHSLVAEITTDERTNTLPEDQQLIAQIYAETLKISTDDITATSDFFELGGTSLHALNAISILNERLNISMSIEDFFDDSSIEAIAKKAEKKGTNYTSEISTLYANCLGIDDNIEINPQDDFFSLGGSSLSALKLLSELKNQYHFDLSIEEFFEKSSIADVEKIISCNKKSDQATTEDTCISDDINIDDDLFFDIESIGGDATLQKAPTAETQKHILLTGAAGFLGTYLLSELLKNNPTITIHCLLRPNDSTNLIDRIKASFKHYHLNNSELNRVYVYEGDIAQEKLGLSEEHYQELSNKIDTIYHCAAFVNHIYSYNMLRSANVLGTIELIKLATTSKKKTIHYVSALDVALIKHNASDFLAEKEAALLEMGYIQTKWVSEYLLEKAASLLDLNISIYRPGNIIGDLKKGIMNPTTNHFSMLTKGCIQLGYAPRSAFLVEMTPVDVVAKSITQLSQRKKTENYSVYNLHNSSYISWEEYIKILNSNGYKINLIDSNIWCHEHIGNIDSTNALYPFKEHYSKNGLRFNTNISELPRKEVSELLKMLNVHFPSDYQSINAEHLNQLREIAFL